MNFELYKSRLIEYFQLQGIKAHEGLTNCFSPNHADKNPSCQLFEDSFKCYSCGIHGDIYDAVEILEGITDKAEQFKRLEKVFGGDFIPVKLAPKPDKEKKKIELNPEACKIFDDYLMANLARKKVVKEFLNRRAFLSSGGATHYYPEDIIENLVNLFGYFPGIEIARSELDSGTLYGAGIPRKANPHTGKYAWGNSGIVAKLHTGYKLHWYDKEICEKRNSLGCETFPMPNQLTGQEKQIILVEGEMDALVCNAAGIENVYAAGGTNGITGPKIKKWLLNIPEIIILFDNDLPGRKMAGIEPFKEKDKEKTSLPEKMRKAGFEGSIKIAELDEYKDPDQAIINGKRQLVIDAIAQAKEWILLPPTENIQNLKNEKRSVATNDTEKGTLTPKEITSFLNKLKIEQLKKEELPPFCSAVINSTPADAGVIKDILLKWGVPPAVLKNKLNKEPSYIVSIAEKYGISYYLKRKIAEKTITKIDLERLATGQEKPIVEIDFEELKKNTHLDNFIFKKDEQAAGHLVAKLLKDKLIYIETENKFYFYDGHVWKRESNPLDIVYTTLRYICGELLLKADTDDAVFVKCLKSTLNKIGQRNFINSIVKNMRDNKLIFKDDVTFDGPQIKETLTLLDSVLDFSGKEPIFRQSFPEEYRRAFLPYSTDEVKEGKTPKKWLKFMNSNFTDKDTLETLLYLLSLIPSRNTQFKVGGLFTGITNTGKTTTMNIMSEIYNEMISPMPRELIMNSGRNNFNASGGLNPHLAGFEGMGAVFCDESQRNDTLNAAMFKQLTGGGMITARGLYAQPRKFMPTAQIFISTNFSPKFDNKDQATIDRMVLIPFVVQHIGDNSKDKDALLQELRPEFPAIVIFLSKYYIDLKNNHKGKIPLSQFIKKYLDDYIEDQQTDLDTFVLQHVEFVKDQDCWVLVKDVYKLFCKVNNIPLDENAKPINRDDWSQSKFTRFLKNDYTEIHVKQKKINGYPEQIIPNMRLKETPPVALSAQTGEKPNLNNSPPEENPFSNE